MIDKDEALRAMLEKAVERALETNTNDGWSNKDRDAIVDRILGGS